MPKNVPGHGNATPHYCSVTGARQGPGLPGTADAQPDNPAARGRVQLLFSVGSLDTAALVWKLKGFSDMNVPESIVRPLLPI